ncbi:MAG: hypothetical protein JKY31_00420 [Rhodobacteraceae bacterium]|nr:hypothetical protein [Paracoccaceae bacterium]
MSFHVTSTCTLRKFGSATRKQIISFLADKASDDGSGIWCSKGTIAQSTELSKSTVKRTITQFLNEGIILETGKRSNSRGYTVEYRINLDQVAQLPLTKELPETTGVTVNPVQHEPRRGSTVHPQGGSPRTPNHPLTIPKPPTRKRDGAEEVFSSKEFETVWGAFPEDRRRNKETCQQIFEEAISQEVTPEDILAAVQTYAQTTAGYTRGKVKFSDNWFRSTSWVEHVTARNEAEKSNALVLQDSLERCKSWISNRSSMCAHISKAQIEALIAKGDVTQTMLISAGIRQ